VSFRILLVATVIGALFIGGAVTGTTLALWRDQATLDGSQVTAGELTFTVKNAPETSVTIGTLPNLVPGGAPATVEGVIRNTSPAEAKNLKLDVKLVGLGVATVPAATGGFSLSHLKIDVRRKPATGCPTLSVGELVDATVSYTTDNLNAAPLSSSNRTVNICLSVAAKSSMPGSAAGTLDLSFSGVQTP
jgi:predicted ribosomally synthesized peptide with SipW-like signal peptide